MIKRTTAIVVAILLVALISQNYAQGKYGEIGKFLKTEHAEILFGKVVTSIPISSNDLREAVSNAKDYVFFSIKNGKVTITNERRKRLTRNSDDAASWDQMFFFSKSIISALVSFAGDGQIFIEQRPNNVNSFTIIPVGNTHKSTDTPGGFSKTGNIMNTTASTSTGITLEMSQLCPPWCD